MDHQILLWIVFNIGVLGMLALDLGVFHRRSHEVSTREALAWSVVWVSLSLLFCWGIDSFLSADPAISRLKAKEFLAGYVIEKALSVDNLFVFIMIFSYFRVPPRLQHRILIWGIIGALVMRGILIAAGTALISRFSWILYIFGAFLVWTAWRMATHDESEEIEPEKNPVIRLFRKFIPIATDHEGSELFIKRGGRWVATPIVIVILVIETTDLVFATDSIPAIFGVTLDPFIVYTSNVFAILGLRALYFLLAGVLEMFRFLKLGVSIILGFVGVKMLIKDVWHVPIDVSLGVIGGLLALAVLASLVFPKPPIPGSDLLRPDAVPPEPPESS